MKNDRRHELQENDLVDSVGTMMDRVRPHVRTFLGIGVLGLLLIASGILISSRTRTTREAAWESFLAALSQGTPEAFEEVLVRYPDSPAAGWSRVVLGDIALSEGTNSAFSNREKSQERLRTAVELYSQVVAERPQGMLAERAVFGLAKSRESLGEIDEAIRGYQAVSTDFPSGALASLSARRADSLKGDDARNWYEWFAAQEVAPPVTSPLDETAPAAIETEVIPSEPAISEEGSEKPLSQKAPDSDETPPADGAIDKPTEQTPSPDAK